LTREEVEFHSQVTPLPTVARPDIFAGVDAPVAVSQPKRELTPAQIEFHSQVTPLPVSPRPDVFGKPTRGPRRR
jgi:hypothetical protein